ncbi:MAG: helix-turn-helix domain-containing protein [Clostridia bacterium]|nr:helix-turn-helix domain-containing protein [Clostridia bacterium]
MIDKNIHLCDQKDEVKAVIAYKIKHCEMTLQQLARQSKLSITTICNLANGKIMPSIKTLFKLSKGMGLNIAQLLFD